MPRVHSFHLTAALILLATVGCGAPPPPPPVSAPPPASAPAPAARPAAPGLVYPKAPRGDVVDELYGTKVPDPYRGLEDLDSPATRAWVKAEERLARTYLDALPGREAIRARLRHLWNYERFGLPHKEGKRYFYAYNPGLKNQSLVYVTEGLHGKPRLLLDPNGLSKDGTVALSGQAVSRDGRLFAYALSDAGSDWKTWHVRDVASGKDLPDVVPWSKFSEASWAHDGSGFYYGGYDPPQDPKKALTGTNYYQKLYFHRLGTSKAQDRLVYERKDQKEWGFGGTVTEDGRYLVIHVWRGTDPKNQLFYLDLRARRAKVVELLTGFDAKWAFVGNKGPIFYLLTDSGAPRGKLVALDLRHPTRDRLKVLVPEGRDTLEDASLVGGRLVASYLADAHSRVAVFDTRGTQLRELALPGLGSAHGFSGKAADPETFYSFTGFTAPTTIYRYDVKTGTSEVFRQPKVDFDPGRYTTDQVFYRSKDGTRVPMFVTHRRDLKLDGQNPTYLYGYGGFDISLTPWFSVSTLVWLELGGVFAVPNLRGGGEYGEAWHRAGTKLHKQNVFDDFIAAAEWLIAHRYTSTPKLAIGGGSNGGLLVGASMIQRPDLFGAVACQVGVLDMLRYDKWTIGWAWASDYGTAADGAAMFRALYAYSPYHNVRPGVRYPPTLISTADHDDRVMPAHSFKFAARLQQAQAGPAPILLRVETRAGHGAGKPTDKIIDELADRYAFLAKALNLRLAPPAAP